MRMNMNRCIMWPCVLAEFQTFTAVQFLLYHTINTLLHFAQYPPQRCVALCLTRHWTMSVQADVTKFAGSVPSWSLNAIMIILFVECNTHTISLLPYFESLSHKDLKCRGSTSSSHFRHVRRTRRE